MNRRLFVKALASSSISAALLSSCKSVQITQSLTSSTSGPIQGSMDKSSVDDWELAEQIKSSIVVPTFQDKTFDITTFGAVNNGVFNNTLAIKNAIKACHEAGGGKVLVPAGKYLTGAIHLLSNVNLHLADNAILSFSTDPQHYLPEVFTRWEGLEMMGYSPLIYAYQQQNIAITGNGTLQGNADNQTWWPWKGPHKEGHWQLIEGQEQKPARDQLMKDAEAHVPVSERMYGDGAFLRPPFIQPYQCENVLIEGITIKNSPFWLLNPVLCKNVTVSAVTFLSHGPNSDGCDPESCDHVLIKNCLFDTGDDCIAIKSGRNADGRRVATPCQNIVIEDCHMKEGHGGVVIGSEISGGVNNVFVQNCTMDSPDLERAIRIKTNSVRGGVIEHIRVRDIEVGTVKNAIVINFFYEEGDAGKFDPTVRDIKIERLHCKNVLS
ncbi:MAG: glycoside hydrolase family 28 protein, partial [Paraglaciecola sp.]|nr:glycoside hydrolase family 28 protein [Paraglaciecola sp.]